jgi:hypothetical protein
MSKKKPATKKTAKKVAAKKPRRVQPPAPVIHVLSDSTGNLPRHMLKSILTQFDPGAFSVRLHTFLDSPRKVDGVLKHLTGGAGLVMHAMVDPEAKAAIAAHCDKAKLPHCDLTGQFVEFLSVCSGIQPQRDLARLHQVDEEYERRINAIEFTIAHDDGLGLPTLGEADIVLVGVSRTSKTPTSLHLAQMGYRAANVSLAIEVQPPRNLLDLPANKVVGLVIDPRVLTQIRSRRWQQTGASSASDTGGYADAEHIRQELLWSRRLFRDQKWATLDVTDQAVEETAARALELVLG